MCWLVCRALFLSCRVRERSGLCGEVRVGGAGFSVGRFIRVWVFLWVLSFRFVVVIRVVIGIMMGIRVLE